MSSSRSRGTPRANASDKSDSWITGCSNRTTGVPRSGSFGGCERCRGRVRSRGCRRRSSGWVGRSRSSAVRVRYRAVRNLGCPVFRQIRMTGGSDRRGAVSLGCLVGPPRSCGAFQDLRPTNAVIVPIRQVWAGSSLTRTVAWEHNRGRKETRTRWPPGCAARSRERPSRRNEKLRVGTSDRSRPSRVVTLNRTASVGSTAHRGPA